MAVIIAGVIVTLVLVVFFTSSVFMRVNVEGPSMLPTYKDGDKVLAIRTRFYRPKVGSCVIARPYVDKSVFVIKRTASISADGSYYYLLGDNAKESLDSRTYGMVPKRDIIAVVI